MTELVRYEAARSALTVAVSVDEVKDIHDVSKAMAYYARQAKDSDLIDKATELRLRAERRLGEMIIAQKETIDMNQGGAGGGKLALVAEGLTNAEIARRLWVAQSTVAKHLEQAYSKLGVHSRTAAVARLARKPDARYAES